ncbi:hypothetical protein RISK_001476 [Rhodopirellula islandica]|uniref:Uncharacterized protein n=1 Tax=Rhodopirellula islandica TaxID=595434 RepID=A0A0J1BI95_RHOIS|nr:hypothetical protein RISK_001476 [Rhodopirellula islandica]
MLNEPIGPGHTDDDGGTTSVREQRRQPRDIAFSIAHRLRPPTEGFYVAVLNEADDLEVPNSVPNRGPLESQPRRWRRCQREGIIEANDVTRRTML